MTLSTISRPFPMLHMQTLSLSFNPFNPLIRIRPKHSQVLQRRNGKSQKNSSFKRSVKPNPTAPGKTAPPGKNECSWCKKNGRSYTGHIHTNCHALKAWKASNGFEPRISQCCIFITSSDSFSSISNLNLKQSNMV